MCVKNEECFDKLFLLMKINIAGAGKAFATGDITEYLRLSEQAYKLSYQLQQHKECTPDTADRVQRELAFMHHDVTREYKANRLTLFLVSAALVVAILGVGYLLCLIP